MGLPTALRVLCAGVLLVACAAGAAVPRHNVTYDSRSLLIDGKRVLLRSGSIHYARAEPSGWANAMALARGMNLNMIETYFMWNHHEGARKGDITWDGNANLTQFLETAAAHDLYVNLRIGPYICGEWNFGGIPWWARDLAGIKFRTDNDVWKAEMARIVGIVVDRIRPYLASNGGPVVMLQIENEYRDSPNKAAGQRYVEWAVAMGHALTTDVPWIMCEHDPRYNTSLAVNTINGFWDENDSRGLTWPSPKYIAAHRERYPDQPLWWTEDQAWYQGWQSGTRVLPGSVVANGILRWYALGGSMHNFYMFYGGNNFGRTAGKMVTTAYANDAPVNPYGLPNTAKYRVLRAAFGAMAAYEDCILGMPPPPAARVGGHPQVLSYTYANATTSVTFLSNVDEVHPAAGVVYGGATYYLAAASTLVLSAVGEVVANSSGDAAGGGSAVHEKFPDCIAPEASAADTIRISGDWLTWSETPGVGGGMGKATGASPIEMWNTTQDTTEYAWYTLNGRTLTVGTAYALALPNAMQSVKDQYFYVYDVTHGVRLAMGTGSETLAWDHANVTVASPEYHMAVLVASFGMLNTGYAYETYKKGLATAVTLNGDDVLTAGWSTEGALRGEALRVYAPDGFSSVEWRRAAARDAGKPLTWWRSTFTTPEGVNVNVNVNGGGYAFASLALDMKGASKGFVYVNGHNIGRYWLLATACRGDQHAPMRWDDVYCPRGLPLQRYYAVPVEYLRPAGAANDIVIFDEVGMGDVGALGLVRCEEVPL